MKPVALKRFLMRPSRLGPARRSRLQALGRAFGGGQQSGGGRSLSLSISRRYLETREKFNTYRFAGHKETVIDLLRRVTRVSVETMKIVELMRVEKR